MYLWRSHRPQINPTTGRDQKSNIFTTRDFPWYNARAQSPMSVVSFCPTWCHAYHHDSCGFKDQFSALFMETFTPIYLQVRHLSRSENLEHSVTAKRILQPRYSHRQKVYFCTLRRHAGKANYHTAPCQTQRLITTYSQKLYLWSTPRRHFCVEPSFLGELNEIYLLVWLPQELEE